VKQFRTEKRKNKIISVLKARQNSLSVVLENIHDPHNVSAIFRTCDAVGVPKISLVYDLDQFPKIGKKSSASALKWVEKERYKSIKECYDSLRENGFKIYASALSESAKNLYELDLTEKVSIVLGNEHRGVSEQAAELADEKFLIPMYGMVQSLNVSVAAAVILYEAMRQRYEKGMYNKSDKNDMELESLIEKWSKR
jgi:tRNA (guanosine-2'-O-)-methyltransferase